MLTEEQKLENRRIYAVAEKTLRAMLKPGDRLRVTKCPGTKRWITFARWDGHWIESKSGINDYPASSVDRVNDSAITFA